jgi:hypothetical protein
MTRITPSIWMNKRMCFGVFVNVIEGEVKHKVLEGRCDCVLCYTSHEQPLPGNLNVFVTLLKHLHGLDQTVDGFLTVL